MSEMLTALQQSVQAASIERVSSPSEQEWGTLTNMEWEKNTPYAVAKVLTLSPYNMSLGVAFAFVFTAMRRKANPFTDMWPAPGGKPGFYVEFEFEELCRSHKVGVPQYAHSLGEWPNDLLTGKPKMLAGKRRKGDQETIFKLENDLVCACTLTIDGEAITQESRFSESFRSSEQWLDNTKGMLQTRALGKCIQYGTGKGLSLATDETGQTVLIEEAPKLGKVVVAK